MKRSFSVIAEVLRKDRAAIILFVLITVLNGAIFYLYDIISEAFFYSEAVLFVILIFILIIDFLRERKKAAKREDRKINILTEQLETAEEGTLSEKDYGEMILLLKNEMIRLKTDFTEGRRADDDYYTAWVHQIKTPIAVMKLQLSEDTEQSRALLSELFRIERYVDMVLDYVRLRSDSNDLVIGEYSADEIVRETLRKFAPQFILRRLKLNYEQAEGTVITDKKWLSFIIEQLISNAVKYTPSGEITVSVNGRKIAVADTGIGIAPEDLPRVFEKGYTGVNGRLGKKSSGLGLFLTKKAARLLNAEIACESTVGKGSTFTLTLPER